MMMVSFEAQLLQNTHTVFLSYRTDLFVTKASYQALHFQNIETVFKNNYILIIQITPNCFQAYGIALFGSLSLQDFILVLLPN